MVFLRTPFSADPPPVLQGAKTMLRIPQMSDYEMWAQLRERNRAFLMPWEPVWPHDDLTRTAFRMRIKRYWRDIEDDLAYPFFVYRAGGDTPKSTTRTHSPTGRKKRRWYELSSPPGGNSSS